MNKTDKFFNHLCDYMTENKMKLEHLAGAFEKLRCLTIMGHVMKDFNKEGNYVVAVSMDDLKESKES